MAMMGEPPRGMVTTIARGRRGALAAGRWVRRRGGWARILRNTIVGYVEQAGSRMAAALSYYSILVGGPILILTLMLGTALFGEEPTRQAVTVLVQRAFPPEARGAGELAGEIVRSSRPAVGLALLAGLGSLLGFTRALSATMNVALRTAGAEPFRRTFVVGPLLLIAVLGLLWGAWATRLLIEMIQLATGRVDSRLSDSLVGGVVPLVLAVLYFAVILAIVPRTGLTRREIVVSAVFGTVLWEGARHVFGWMVGSESAYTRLFGPLGGVVALLGWVYVSSAILVLTGQFAWAYSMERRGRGPLATAAPREAGLDGWIRPFHGDNSVNEDHPC